MVLSFPSKLENSISPFRPISDLVESNVDIRHELDRGKASLSLNSDSSYSAESSIPLQANFGAEKVDPNSGFERSENGERPEFLVGKATTAGNE
ncbi:hypothetical protein V6N13_133834 [Hibiscus sabdariffa]